MQKLTTPITGKYGVQATHFEHHYSVGSSKIESYLVYYREDGNGGYELLNIGEVVPTESVTIDNYKQREPNPNFDSSKPEDPVTNPKTILKDYNDWNELRTKGSKPGRFWPEDVLALHQKVKARGPKNPA